jgi:hypothetical protein
MRAATAYLAVFALASALFLLLPQIDLMTSALFYTSDRGFLLKNWRPAAWLYDTGRWLVWGIAVLTTFGTCWLLLVKRPMWRLDRKALCFIAASMVLAPGLIVNTLLKDHWGRAWPNQIAELGETRQFSPAPLPNAGATAPSRRAMPRSAFRSLRLPFCCRGARRGARVAQVAHSERRSPRSISTIKDGCFSRAGRCCQNRPSNRSAIIRGKRLLATALMAS